MKIVGGLFLDHMFFVIHARVIVLITQNIPIMIAIVFTATDLLNVLSKEIKPLALSASILLTSKISELVTTGSSQ